MPATLKPLVYAAPGEIRTPDPLVRSQVLDSGASTLELLESGVRDFCGTPSFIVMHGTAILSVDAS